jgi:hypothetical protein
MDTEDTKAAPSGTDSGKAGLEALVDAPKGGDGAPSVDDKSKPEGDAHGSPTSSSRTGPPSADEALEIAARAERRATLESEAAARRTKEADDRFKAAEEKEKAADAKLATAAELMLAREDLTRGEKIAALKKFMGQAYDPADLIQALSLDIPVPGEDGKPVAQEKPLADQVKDIVDGYKKADADKAEEARKAAEAKKAEDDKKRADEDRQRLIGEWRELAAESLKPEEHPILAAKFERWKDDFGPERAKQLIQDLALETFWDVAKKFNEDGTPRAEGDTSKPPRALDADEAIALAEMRLAKKAKPVKTIMDEQEEALAAIDRQDRERESTGPFRRDPADEPKPKRRSEMTVMEMAEAEAEALDKAAGRASLY